MIIGNIFLVQVSCGTNRREFSDSGLTAKEQRLVVDKVVVHPQYDAATNRQAHILRTELNSPQIVADMILPC